MLEYLADQQGGGMHMRIKLLLTIVLMAASAPGQEVHGESEIGVVANGTRSFSQYLWENFDGGKLQLMQRFFPADGRQPRWEFGVATNFKLKGLAFNPTIGFTTDGYVITVLVMSGSVHGHRFVYIGDHKWGATSTKPGFLYEKAFAEIGKGFWLRWEGVWLDNNRWVATQPGMEYRHKLGKKLGGFVAGQYDFTSRQALAHTGIRF